MKIIDINGIRYVEVVSYGGQDGLIELDKLKEYLNPEVIITIQSLGTAPWTYQETAGWAIPIITGGNTTGFDASGLSQVWDANIHTQNSGSSVMEVTLLTTQDMDYPIDVWASSENGVDYMICDLDYLGNANGRQIVMGGSVDGTNPGSATFLIPLEANVTKTIFFQYRKDTADHRGNDSAYIKLPPI